VVRVSGEELLNGEKECNMRLRQIVSAAFAAIANVILGGNLVSLTLLKSPRRTLQYVSETLFLYRAIGSKRGVPQRNVYEVLQFNDTENIELGCLKQGGTWFFGTASYAVDIVSLCLLCRAMRPRVIFEIGTMRGYTAFHLALNSPDDAEIYTLDLPKNMDRHSELSTTLSDDAHIESYRRARRYCFDKSNVSSKITCLFGDSATFDFSPYHSKVDLFFIDGAHSYEYVRSDTLQALRCCHTTSVIVWHDFGRSGVNGVSRWLRELSKTLEVYSIPGGSLAFSVLDHRDPDEIASQFSIAPNQLGGAM
jgi:predicted O-methyltransferase YrrM